MLFWSVYFIDKSLSLRLGRAAALQDFDISTSPKEVLNIWKDQGPGPFDYKHDKLMEWLDLSLEMARIQVGEFSHQTLADAYNHRVPFMTSSTLLEVLSLCLSDNDRARSS
jgi:hypothetical protein